MNKLKKRWGIESSFQLIIILIVFSITGSAAVFIAKPFLGWVGLERGNFPDAWWSASVYWTLRIMVIFPIYQILLVVFGWLFGQFKFFWSFEKKMLNRIGLGFLFK
mgnify:CR=1 FL=1